MIVQVEFRHRTYRQYGKVYKKPNQDNSSNPLIFYINTIKMHLLKIDDLHFENMLSNHDSDGGNSINLSLSKLFVCMDNESSRFEVSIKVAALNQLYSTAIQYISPVVNKIIDEVDENHKSFNENQYANLVDKISTATWQSSTTGKDHSRCNLSFASKYVHFLSMYKIPIYDSYIWIVMIGYLKQYVSSTYSFTPPTSYKDFYDVFSKFKNHFKLNERSIYNIDKFLWQYGKNLIVQIIEEEKIELDKAKNVLKKRISFHVKE